MAKQILFDEEARRQLREGARRLASVVRVTYGPSGRNVMLEKKFGSSTLTKDGLNVSREIELEDPFLNMGAKMIHEITRSSSGTSAGRILLPVVVAGLALATLIAFGIVQVKRSVDQRIARAGGEWQLEPEFLPPWLPGDFQGEMVGLRDLPETVSLRSVRWRDQIRESLLASPWIEKVGRIDLDGDRIIFDAEMTRPVAGVRCHEGFLLIDSIGRVIDTQPGDILDGAWGIPEYLPEGGGIDPLAAGFPLIGAEFRELVALLDVLWDEEIFQRWPGVIPQITSRRDDSGGRLWQLITARGTHLYWGRSPAANLAEVATVEEKITCLREVLPHTDRLQGAGGVSLFSGDEPVVVGRW